MYFAINSPDAALPELIMQDLEVLQSEPANTPLHLFALVDGAFDEQLLSSREWRRVPRKSLYDNTVLAEFGAAAPQLLTAPAGATEQRAWLEQLFAACKGKPMLSIIASTLGSDALQRHLRPYLMAITSDSLEWPLRWGDARVLPALLGTLAESQRDHLLSPLYRWWSTQRDGTLVSWRGTALHEPVPPGFDKLPMSEGEFVGLVDAAEADAVLSNIEDNQPDLLRAHSPAQCHARVARHLELASANGIDAAGAREHFSVLALMLADDFAGHPAMASLLQRTRQGADYHAEIAGLPGDFWEAATVS
ncbi:hypothetical protein AAKU55_004494 [Oxalobacteraceae bacterium GrIS 1.11]